MKPYVLLFVSLPASADIVTPGFPERGEVTEDLPPPVLPAHAHVWTDPPTVVYLAIFLLLMMGAIIWFRMRLKRSD